MPSQRDPPSDSAQESTYAEEQIVYYFYRRKQL